MIPNGWQHLKLEEIASKSKYSMVDGPFGSNLKSEHYRKSGVNVLQSGFVTSGKFIAKKYVYVDQELFDKQKRSAARAGDILMAKIGAQAGRCGIIPKDHPESIIAGNCLKLSFDENVVSTHFMHMALTWDYDRTGLIEIKTETAQPAISLKNLRSYKVLMPTLPEQLKIAKIVSSWDLAISIKEQLIKNSKKQKKSLMQKLLTGNQRLVDGSGQTFEDCWKELKIGDLFERVLEKNKGQSTNVVTISAKQGLIRQEEYFKKSVASEILDNYFILKKGQFAYNKSYSNGYPMGAIKRLNRYENGVVTTLYICFKLKDEELTSSCFMEQLFESGIFNRGLSRVAAEGGRAHGLLNVKPADFMSLTFKVPNYTEQKKISAVLINADREIELLERQLIDLKQEKKALMQQLLTGKRRVKIDEEAA